MDGESPSLAVGPIRRGKVKGLAVMEHHPAGGQVDDDGLTGVDPVARIEKGVGLLRHFVVDGGEMRSRDDVHRAVFAIDVIKGQPTAYEIGRHALPVGIVLVPENGISLTGGLVKGLIVKELEVGAEKILHDVQDAFVVEQLAKNQAALAHLHNLKHLGTGVVLLVDAVGVVDREIAEIPGLTGLAEKTVVLIPEDIHEVVVEKLTDREVAIGGEPGDLARGQRTRCGFHFILPSESP